MLADKHDVPICCVELAGGSLYTTPEYITTRSVDNVRADVAFKGGIGARVDQDLVERNKVCEV